MATAEVLTTAPVNWSSLLEQVRRDYEAAKGIAHGLQKDAIQNGWGARDGRKKWRFDFRLFSPGRGKPLYLTMTDMGTTGLTGDVFDYEMLAFDEQLPPEQRLARFECMFDSGGNVGPGLYGRGKLLFNAASKKQLVYYDSLTKNGVYRFGKREIIGRKCEQFKRVYQGEDAKRQLDEHTDGALKPLEFQGTRITVVNPIDEVVAAIENGDFLRAIEETWWEIILKHNAQITVQVGNTPPEIAQLPVECCGLPEQNRHGWRVYLRNLLEIEVAGQKHRIKRMHLLLPPKDQVIPENLRGISIHRAGMKVGPVPLHGIPEEIRDRFFGYVWLEPGLESLFAEIEDTTHYGFARSYRAAYRNVKRQVDGHVPVFRAIGFRAPSQAA